MIDIFIQGLNNVQANRTLKELWNECNEQAQIYCNSMMHWWLFAVVVFIFKFLHVCNEKTQMTYMSIQSHFYRKNKMSWTGGSQLVLGPKNKLQAIFSGRIILN